MTGPGGATDRTGPDPTAPDLPLPLLTRGKVRDVYAVGDEAVLLVASDRISAYDAVLPTTIPDKGAVLTGLSLWWFGQLADLVPNHTLTAVVADYPAELQPYADALRGRSMLCRRLEMIPVECVARAYLAGSAVPEYRETGHVAGVELPAGLVEGDRLPRTIFTPTTKAPQGEHDEAIVPAAVTHIVGGPVSAQLQEITVAVLERAGEIAADRGILVADTKLEFGFPPDSELLMLADEVLTPDSSRFWPADSWQPGGPQPSYDKQYVRDWLQGSGWDRQSPPPELPDEVVQRTRERYVQAYEQLTGRSFADYLASS